METKIRVLIADPNEDMRLILSENLGREEDLEVVGTAADGPETLSMVTELEPDVVLMELVLPKLDGLGVLRKLSESGRETAVLVMTGFVNSNLDFSGQPKVIDGASRLLKEIFGEKGSHTRSAVGMAGLPGNAACEIELIVLVD